MFFHGLVLFGVGWVPRTTQTPFHLPISDILCQTSPMKNLTATLCLTIAVLHENAVMYRNANQSFVSAPVRDAHAE